MRRRYTAQALDTLITSLEEQGYSIVPISELIYPEDFHMNFEGRQIKNETADSVNHADNL